MSTWMNRCYENDIPDLVPDKVMDSMRAPSYKAVAIAILKNDHNLHALGFCERDSDAVDYLIEVRKNKNSKQLRFQF